MPRSLTGTRQLTRNVPAPDSKRSSRHSQRRAIVRSIASPPYASPSGRRGRGPAAAGEKRRSTSNTSSRRTRSQVTPTPRTTVPGAPCCTALAITSPRNKPEAAAHRRGELQRLRPVHVDLEQVRSVRPRRGQHAVVPVQPRAQLAIGADRREDRLPAIERRHELIAIDDAVGRERRRSRPSDRAARR